MDAALFGYRFAEWPGPRPYAQEARSEGLAAGLDAWLADPLFVPVLATPASDHIPAIVREFTGDSWLGAGHLSPADAVLSFLTDIAGA